MNIQEEIRRIEEEIGRFIGGYEITPEGIRNVELLPYGPGDFLLSVWNCRISLMRAVRVKDGNIYSHTFIEALSPTAYEREDVQEWLEQALEAAGGFINMSGHYPLVVPVPEWLEPEIIIAALGR